MRLRQPRGVCSPCSECGARLVLIVSLAPFDDLCTAIAYLLHWRGTGLCYYTCLAILAAIHVSERPPKRARHGRGKGELKQAEKLRYGEGGRKGQMCQQAEAERCFMRLHWPRRPPWQGTCWRREHGRAQREGRGKERYIKQLTQLCRRKCSGASVPSSLCLLACPFLR